MSAPICERHDEQRIELGTAVSWPPILAAAALGLVLLIVASVVVINSGTDRQPAKEPQMALRNDVPVRTKTRSFPTDYEPIAEPCKVPTQPIVVPSLTRRPVLPATQLTSPTVVVKASDPLPNDATPTPVAIPPVLPPASAQQVVEAPPTPTFKRRHSYSEEALRSLLYQDARELDIEAEKGTSAKLLEAEQKITRPKSEASKALADKAVSRPSSTAPIRDLIARRADLKGLPVRDESECRVSKKEAEDMQLLSRAVRSTDRRGRRSRDIESSQFENYQREKQLVDFLNDRESRGSVNEDAAVRTLKQMLQVENYRVRLHLVKLLAAIKGKNAGSAGKAASTALSERAVFDLSPMVREAAVEALKGRPGEEYRPQLLAAFRYPWARAADHAAEALVALDDHAALCELVGLLDEANPRAPSQDKDKKWVEPELVRVGHLGNCLLCHAPSSGRDDPIRALTPERGKPLPVVYYDRGEGTFVRADVTYLRQDFSVVLPVTDPGKWPSEQRFDFLVRQRELSADEVTRLIENKAAGEPPTYPQREAVLWALRELTGQDRGVWSEDWYQELLDSKYEQNR